VRKDRVIARDRKNPKPLKRRGTEETEEIRAAIPFLLDAFYLTPWRTNGKVRDSLQSGKVVLWTVFEN